jgi:hypothetical protein
MNFEAAASALENARQASLNHRGPDYPCREDEAVVATLADAQSEALEALLEAPAENLADVRRKIDLFDAAEGVHLDLEAKALLDALRVDLDRLERNEWSKAKG